MRLKDEYMSRKVESLIDSWESVTLGTEAREEVKVSLVRAFRESERTAWREALRLFKTYSGPVDGLLDIMRQRAEEA